MANLTLKGIPPDLHVRLRLRAERNRRSLNAEILGILEQAVDRKPLDVEALLARIHEIHRKGRIKPLTEEELQAARRERRF